MILLAYILLGHPDWNNGYIKIFAVYPESEKEEQQVLLYNLIDTGRLPISKNNILIIEGEGGETNSKTIERFSQEADLTIVGFLQEDIKKNNIKLFNEYNNLGNVLYVSSNKEKEIN